VGRKDREDLFCMYSQKALRLIHAAREIQEMQSEYRSQRLRRLQESVQDALKHFIKRSLGKKKP